MMHQGKDFFAERGRYITGPVAPLATMPMAGILRSPATSPFADRTGRLQFQIVKNLAQLHYIVPF
jgi:hypothetical protein